MRMDAANWRLGAIYVCRSDPRVIVRNRRGPGWTWNFGHGAVWLVMPACVLALFAPLLLSGPPVNASPGLVIAACIAAFCGLVWVAHRIAQGPR